MPGRRPVADHQRDGCHHIAAGARIGTDRHGVVGDLSIADGATARALLGEHCPQSPHIGHRVLGGSSDRSAAHLVLDVEGRVSQEDQAHARPRHPEMSAHSGQHRHGTGPGDPLDEHHLRAFPDRQLHVLSGDRGQALKERQS